ncbi:hypothetical protein MtrunA17_Chr2g0318951 [Medicago truncatula]|uniref:Transmembrane protein n=1 Tax=Medicago truncatula TaxID=3880 RepID=A0A396JDT8_MEDTR|nr:hypothetical protein MtrunA17_Chr2g0318951 [Medicago truncatula]
MWHGYFCNFTLFYLLDLPFFSLPSLSLTQSHLPSFSLTLPLTQGHHHWPPLPSSPPLISYSPLFKLPLCIPSSFSAVLSL